MAFQRLGLEEFFYLLWTILRYLIPVVFIFVVYRILASVNEFSEIAIHVLQHHEKWNGKGYPKGIKGEEISLQARVIAIADAYDAMTGNRTYRTELSEEEAIAEIRRCSGTQFDPDISRIYIEKVLGKEWGQICSNKNELLIDS